MNLAYETKKQKQGFEFIVGVDEVGRGSLAGPVVACAVIFDCLRMTRLSKIDQNWTNQINDSKQLTPKKREELAEVIKENAVFAFGEVSPEVIDEINIHNATLLAMKKAVEGLLFQMKQPEKIFVVVDGKFKIPEINFSQEAVIDGDNQVFSIAAASIVAKVYRDGLMRELGEAYEKYEFSKHKGYGTLSHRQAILKHGLSPIHRISFCSNLV